MKNSYAIAESAKQLKQVAERIEAISFSIETLEQSGTAALPLFLEMRLDELEHAQKLTIILTELISSEMAVEEDKSSDVET